MGFKWMSVCNTGAGMEAAAAWDCRIQAALNASQAGKAPGGSTGSLLVSPGGNSEEMPTTSRRATWSLSCMSD